MPDITRLPQEFYSGAAATVMAALTVSGVVLMLIGEQVQPAKLLRWSEGGGRY